MRAIAVLLVVWYHTMGILSKEEYLGAQLIPEAYFKRGVVGVDLFFVISGFIIAYVSLANDSLRAKVSLDDFVVRRLVRIVPFLWFAVLLYAAIRTVTVHEFQPMPYLNAMFPVNPVGELRPNVVWSLRHELWFYGIFGVSFLLRKRMPWLVYAWTLVPLVAILVFRVADYEPQSEFLQFLVSSKNFNFAVGLTIGLAYKRSSDIRRLLSMPRTIAWAGVTGATAGVVVARNAVPVQIVALLAGVVLIFGLSMPRTDGVVARTWELLGDASYSIYLLHSIAILLGAEVWTRVLGDRFGWAAFVLIATGSTLFGVIAHVWAEKPIIRTVNRMVHRSQRTAVTPSEPAEATPRADA